MAITGRTALLALLGALVVFAVPAGGATVGWVEAVLALGVIVDAALAGAPRQLEVSRSGATRTRLGEPATVTLTLHNRGRRTVRAVVRDGWPPSAGAAPARLRVVVPPGERRWADVTLTPSRRGDRRPHRVTIRSLGPLGLAGRQSWRVVPWTLRVLPAFASRRHLPERLARLRQLDGLVTASVRGQGSEFDSLRDYVPGDDVRSIDWRATARRDSVVVRTWRPERDRRVLLVVDTSRTAAARVGDAPRLDAAIEAALLLGALAARAGDRVSLLAYDRAVRASADRVGRDRTLAALVDALAPLEAALVEPDLAGLVRTVLQRAGRRSLVVLFTALDPSVAEEALVPVLPVLTRRHRVLVASVSDPRVAELAAGRGDAAAVYAAAAAEHALAGRQRVGAALRRGGVEVVDAPPDTFAPAVADAYLALKAAGRL